MASGCGSQTPGSESTVLYRRRENIRNRACPRRTDVQEYCTGSPHQHPAAFSAHLTIHHYYSTVLYAVIRRVRTCTWHSAAVFCCTVKLQKFSRYACLCGCIFFSTVYDCAGFPRRAELLGSQPLIVLLRNSRCARSYVDEDSSELPDISGRTSELVHQKTPRSANSCGNFFPVQLPSELALRLRHRHWQVWVALIHCVLCSILPLVSLNITLIF